MQNRVFILALCLLLSLFLASCGGILNFSSTSNPNSTLEGNWHLIGEGSLIFGDQQFPLLTLALFVDGTTVYGSGDVGLNCAQPGTSWGGSLEVVGQIAADGTFSLASSSPLDSIQVAIQGKAPTQGATTWNGSYILSNGTTGFGCTINQSGTFTATQYPQFKGTYAGTIPIASLSASGRRVNSDWNFTLQVTQDPVTTIPRRAPLPPIFYFPLTSTISVSGSPCFTSGTISSNWVNDIAGDSFNLSYTMNDGSTLQLSGTFSDQTESKMELEIVSVIGGSCNDDFGSGTLALQP